MEEVRLKRRGNLFKDEDGTLVLVNDDNEAYKVDEVVAYIWSICDGKTETEVINEFASISETGIEEIRDPLLDLLKRLRAAALIE
ncbi:MAG: PqqD family protein [Nitrososphaeria archaeon]|nr:PqqD family protein [Nitrososphaeria archaeon]MDW8022084.1 PqqD family protein [Nitrososphaerota archaeon]